MGAVKFGIAPISAFQDRLRFLNPKATRGTACAASLAVRLSDPILDEIEDHPTKIYYYHYRRINIMLDQIALRLMAELQSLGHRALPIPSSQVVDWEKQLGHLSHKHVAAAAGLGWIGRNNLLVTPEFGSRVRLITVLTDCRLPVDPPLDMGCGSCKDCLTACPAKAITESVEGFDHVECFKLIRSFRKRYNIGQDICGVCVRACPGPKGEPLDT